jgi:hypothetical protein
LNSKGFTLAEVLISSSLGLLLTALILLIFITVGRRSQKIELQVQASALSQEALDKLNADVENSNPDGIQLLHSSNRDYLVLQALKPELASTAQSWNPSLIYWVFEPSTEKLTRAEGQLNGVTPSSSAPTIVTQALLDSNLETLKTTTYSSIPGLTVVASGQLVEIELKAKIPKASGELETVSNKCKVDFTL